MLSLRWTRLLPAVAVAALVGAGVSAAPAYAHNQLSASTPADGEVLDQAPASVILDFMDTLNPANTTVTITGPNGEVADGPPSFDGSEVTVPLRVSSAGRYTVGYELIAEDGHIGSGQVAFELTAQAAPSPSPSPEQPSPSPTPPAAAATTSPATPAAAAASDDADEGSPAWVLWAVGGAIGIALGFGAVAWFRRRGGTTG